MEGFVMKGISRIPEDLQRQAKAYRDSMYDDRPGVKEFLLAKHVCLGVLAGLLLVDLVLYCLLCVQGLVDSSALLLQFRKLFYHLILLGIALLGVWKPSLGLLLIAVPSLITMAQTLQVIGSLSALLSFPFPLLLLFLVESIYTLLATGTVLWLTVLPRSRRRAGEAHEVYLAYQRFLQERMPTEDGQVQ